jgi:two-component system cell cycle response regulator
LDYQQHPKTALMRTDLYTENQFLRRQLRELIAQARKNEQKLRRIQAQESRLISTNSLFELVQRIIYDYRTSSSLDFVTLTLIDPEYEIQRILTEQGVDLAEHPGLVFLPDEDDLNRLYGISVTPKLGPFSPAKHHTLFPSSEALPASTALLPLVRHNELIGSLNLGSVNKKRFIANTATDFLERLAAIVAIGLENATNHERLKRIGLTDPLTGVNNRRFFDQRLTEEIARAIRSAAPLSCLLLDIDKFKQINDTYGHQTGDHVLINVAALIKKQMRGSDVLARYGGEEFVALLINASSEEAIEIAERVRRNIAAHKFAVSTKREHPVTISIGVATLFENKSSTDANILADELINRADQALYTAKDTGRNRVFHLHFE